MRLQASTPDTASRVQHCADRDGMLTPRQMQDLMSGGAQGLLASAARLALLAASVPYGLAVRLRNTLFDRGWRQVVRADVPVVSLGNLTTGGTGKTPFAAHVARWYRARGVRVCFVSRGYGAEPGAANDEVLVLDLLCPDVPHLPGPDRVASARIACEELESQLLILDDGFQHRRLKRDLDLVLIDATNPWGYGHLLPRGLLREPPAGLRRAHAVVLTRVDQATAAQVDAIRRRVARIRGADDLICAAFPPVQLVNSVGASAALESLGRQRVLAFCGIGNPDAFASSLRLTGMEIAGLQSFDDHHAYTRQDVDDLRRWAASATDAAAVLTTQKDLVKIGLEELGGRPLWAVEIGVRIVEGADRLDAQLARLLPADRPADAS